MPAAKASFAREQKLLDEMTEIAEAARGLPDARVRRLIEWIRENMCPDLPQPGKPRPATPPEWNDIRVIIFTEYDDTKRYLQQQLAGGDRGHRPGRAADRHLPRPDAAGGAGGDQAGVQRRPGEASGPHPHRHRRRPRRPQPPGPLLEPVPLRRALESQPHGAAQRPHRPQAPAARRGLLPLLRLQAAAGGPHPHRRWSARRRRSRRSWAACPRSSTPAWPTR